MNVSLTHFFGTSANYVTLSRPVYRVNWLRAKSRRDRWSEEIELLASEMQWVRNYHGYQETLWRNRASKAVGDDSLYYAQRQEKTWELFGQQAENALRMITKTRDR